MLDTKAYRKRLGFQEDAGIMQHLESVARTMADCEYGVTGMQLVAIGKMHRT